MVFLPFPLIVSFPLYLYNFRESGKPVDFGHPGGEEEVVPPNEGTSPGFLLSME
jgi:hypothetical protein